MNQANEAKIKHHKYLSKLTSWTYLKLYMILLIHLTHLNTSYREQDLMMEEYGAIWDPENFTFTYKMDGETYELYDEQQILYPLIDTTDYEV